MEIKFNKNFIKLHNQTSAQLIDVKMVDLSCMNDDDFNELKEYDCKADDGSYYPLDRNGYCTLLIFLGNKNIVFQTIRKKESFMKYYNQKGIVFDIYITDK